MKEYQIAFPVYGYLQNQHRLDQPKKNKKKHFWTTFMKKYVKYGEDRPLVCFIWTKWLVARSTVVS